MIEKLSALLFYPFEKGVLAYPAENSKIIFWNMVYTVHVDGFENSYCVQLFKPYAETFQAQNIKTYKEFPYEVSYQNIFCTLPKQKDAALYMIAKAFDSLEEDGMFLCVSANDAGGKNIEKWLKEFGAIPVSLSKSKCRIVWAYRKNINPEKINFYINKGAQQKITIEGQSFVTQAGIYGWNKIDKGSKLLLQNLPDSLKGIGADFGCGYGYLSFKILEKHSKIKKLYALEADNIALACAQQNLKHYEDNVDIEYGWVDLTKRQDITTNLDWIIMNPPFHDGKQMSVDVGQSFITQAARALKKNGVLYMVANAHLPYEKILEKLFSNVTKTCEEQGYKIFIATK